MVQRGANPKLKDKKGTTARAMCNKKTLKEVKKAERVVKKRPEPAKIIFRDWLHTFELEIQTYVNMTECDRDLLVQILTEQLTPPIDKDEIQEFVGLISKVLLQARASGPEVALRCFLDFFWSEGFLKSWDFHLENEVIFRIWGFSPAD